MRLIGLLGGMSWQSSAEYYRILNELVQQRLGGHHSARCLLYSVDFEPIEVMQTKGDWANAATQLAGAARALEVAGADFIVLCTNTMHKVADDIQAAISIPLLHLTDATAAAIKQRNIHDVGLLGTRFTMTEAFYRDRLAAHGLHVQVPSFDDQQLVDDIIYRELCFGTRNPASREAYRQVIQRLVDSGAEGVIYGCTEIELLVDQTDSVVPVFPTTRLHCELAAEHAMAAGQVRHPDRP